MAAVVQPAFHDLAPDEASFEASVLSGLAQARKSLPCRFLYDERGSALFDAICLLPEYYLTRTETAILAQRAVEIARMMGPGVQIVEFGSGSSIKIRRILDLLVEPAGYVPIDISGDHLRRAAESIAARHPNIPVSAVCADYTASPQLPARLNTGFAKRVGFFPGSSIGNLQPPEAVALLREIRRLIGVEGEFLIGVDTKKEPAIIEAAYNDSAGVSAAFTLNILTRINRELGGDFDLDAFDYHAIYAPREGRVEISVMSRRDQRLRVAGRNFRLDRGELILVEYSYKYAIDEFAALARIAGLEPRAIWTDPDRLFALYYLARR